MNRTPLKIGVAFGLALFFSWVYLFTPQVFYSLDNKLRDFMFIIRGELPKNKNIIIIDIDNKSLKEIGQWPWSRDKIAKLIDNLTEANAGIIGLDMVFAEEDRSSPHKLIKQFPTISQKLPNYDEILAKTFSTAPVVGGYIFTSQKATTENTPFIPAVFIQKGIRDSNYFTEQQGIILNTPILQNALYSSGFFITSVDAGGTIRSIPLIKKYKGSIYSSLAFEMVRIYSQINKVEVIGDNYGIQFITFGKNKIPTGNSGELIINFRGPQKHFTYLSASDIIKGHFDPKDIENRFILLGTSAAGLKDLRSTPYDSVFPGVEVHANIIDNLLQKDFLYKPTLARLYDLAIIWVLIFTLMFIFSRIGSWLIIPFAIVAFYLLAYLLYTILFNYGIVLALLTPLLALISTLIVSIGIDYFFTSKQKEQAKQMLGKKVSPSVMNYLLEHTHEDLIAPKEVEATIFFSDIRGFTSISEQIGSPNQLIGLLNTYMTPMADTIIRYEGTIDKYIGDAIMAYWNAPIKIKHHADAAVTSALTQIALLKEINQTIHAQYNVTIAIGIGIHTGVVTAGDMGSEGRSDYTVIGDNVNIASRLESLTKRYDAQILITESTYHQLEKKYPIRSIDIVHVKGRHGAIKIFEVLTEDKKELATYEEAIVLYREAKLDEALILFNALTQMYTDPLYILYKQRCEHFLNNPSLKFTPVFTMSGK